MVQEQRRAEYGWMFPGGRANNCEPIFHTARRKVAEETGINAEPLAIIALRHKVLKTYSNIGSFFFFCLMRVNYESGVEQSDLPTPSDGFSAWWFTREELRQLDDNHFFLYHREVFMAYDNWQDSRDGNEVFSALADGSSVSHMFYFSSV
ncbi:hypothetical protein Aduo_002345 [Ancylostoma duodenale]